MDSQLPSAQVTYDCIIIGAGPAGIIAAIQLRRSGFNVLLFEKNRVGGLLSNAKRVENYLGFVEGISGEDLVDVFEKQLQTFDIEVIPSEVQEVTKEQSFVVRTDNSDYEAKTVIIATGTAPIKAGLEGEEELSGTRVFYHVSDIPLTEEKKVVLIIGGGDAGFDYAVHLKEKGHEPTIITKGEIRCLPLLKEEATALGIPHFEHVTPQAIRAVGENIEIVCEEKKFSADYVLIAVGREPRLPPLPIKSEGLFLAGDVHGDLYRQVHIATGDALLTAMKVAEYLQNR